MKTHLEKGKSLIGNRQKHIIHAAPYLIEKELIENSFDRKIVMPSDGRLYMVHRNAKNPIGKHYFATLDKQRPVTL